MIAPLKIRNPDKLNEELTDSDCRIESKKCMYGDAVKWDGWLI